MKEIIVKAFKDIFHIDVRVIIVPEDDIYAIYVLRDKMFVDMSEENLSEYAFDFAIAHSKNEDNDFWFYITTYNVDGITKNGEVVSPPDVEFVESKNTYDSLFLALKMLLYSEIDAKLDDILVWSEERDFRM